MTTSAMQTFSALLGLMALGGAIALIVARIAAIRSAAAASVVEAVAPSALWLAFVVAATSMLGSLYFSEVAHFAPCKLCWYQRIAMYSLAIILLIAAVKKDRGVIKYAVPLAVIGLVVSTYHYLLEWFPQIETSVCSLDVPCTAVWFREFGFVSLSLMAGSAFLAIIVLLVGSSTWQRN